MKYSLSLKLLVLLPVLLFGLVAVVPAPKVEAAAPLCFNRLAGALPFVCFSPKNGEIIDGKTVGKDPNVFFKNDTCYTFSDVEKGWVVDDCNSEIFKTRQGAQPIGAAEDPANSGDCSGNRCDIMGRFINPIINFLAVAFGLIVTIILTIAGIQYGSSGDDPAKVAAAKERIINAILGLGGFIFVWAFIQWLVPGGVF